MWYSHNNIIDTIDYSYLHCLFESQEETDNFLRIFIEELKIAKVNFLSAIANQKLEIFRQTHHNVKPHLEILKINNLNATLEQAKAKLMAPDQPFEDRDVYIYTIGNAFDAIIRDINKKLIS